jgi:AcrR family transcriptional regulator
MPKSTGVRAAQRAATISRILAAAREEFARDGSAATVRSIARRAHVDPSLVMQYFTSKDALFTAATAVSEGESGQHLRDVLAAKLDEPPPETMALFRSMLTNPTAADAVREFLNDRVANLARHDNRPDAELTAALTVSTFLGLTVARHFLHLDAFEHASKQDLERVASQWLNLPARQADSAETTAAGLPARVAELGVLGRQGLPGAAAHSGDQSGSWGRDHLGRLDRVVLADGVIADWAAPARREEQRHNENNPGRAEDAGGA